MPPVTKPKASRKAVKKGSSSGTTEKTDGGKLTRSERTKDPSISSGPVQGSSSVESLEGSLSTTSGPTKDNAASEASMPPTSVPISSTRGPAAFADGYQPPALATNLFDAFHRTSTRLTDSAPKRYLCTTWTRVIHSVPKCDVCHGQAGEVGTLQLCGCGKITICKGCVEDGYLGRRNKTGVAVTHKMNMGSVNWSVVRDEERRSLGDEKGRGLRRVRWQSSDLGTKKEGLEMREVAAEDDEVDERNMALLDSLKQPAKYGAAQPQMSYERTTAASSSNASNPGDARHELFDARLDNHRTNITLPPLRELELPRGARPIESHAPVATSDGGPRQTPHSREISQPNYDQEQLEATAILLGMRRDNRPREQPQVLDERSLPEVQRPLPQVLQSERPLPQTIQPSPITYQTPLPHHLFTIAHTLLNDSLSTQDSLLNRPVAPALIFEAARSWTRGELSELRRSEGVSPMEAWEDLCRVVTMVGWWLGVGDDLGVREWLEMEREKAEQRMRVWEEGWGR